MIEILLKTQSGFTQKALLPADYTLQKLTQILAKDSKIPIKPPFQFYSYVQSGEKVMHDLQYTLKHATYYSTTLYFGNVALSKIRSEQKQYKMEFRVQFNVQVIQNSSLKNQVVTKLEHQNFILGLSNVEDSKFMKMNEKPAQSVNRLRRQLRLKGQNIYYTYVMNQHVDVTNKTWRQIITAKGLIDSVDGDIVIELKNYNSAG